MVSWNEGEEGDNWVTYGTAFSDDETDEGRFRALQFGKHSATPAAYEQRVLNARGRPLRFHGAFTGGFSAGYFNTVGSKEGFQPRSFHSSRKTRQRDTEEQVLQRPEDFMDEEDFGEHGIAPRRIKMAHTFDDTHIHDSLKVALGGQSIIPGAGSVLKDLIIPSKGPLANRLLRKMGWKDTGGVSELDVMDDQSASIRSGTQLEAEAAVQEKSSGLLYAQICFDAKSNTFGLGYSGLNPDIAMGRRPQLLTDHRHPEESATAMFRRHSNLQTGFAPNAGPVRAGIQGQAFGVGALEVEDEDVYATEHIADYDWEIGDVGSAGEDDEEAEMEAARLGRWSGSVRKPSRTAKATEHKTFDGWTAPSKLSSARAAGGYTGINVIDGFVAESEKSQRETTGVTAPSVHLPPGYMPVFNPLCVRDPNNKSELSDSLITDSQKTSQYRRLDAVARSRLLEEENSGSVFTLLDPVERLRMQAAAAGFPVPSIPIPTPAPKPELATPVIPKPDTLLKSFKNDSAKQARFEAFQVLIRRGFTPEVAYTRCTGGVDMPGEEREHELNAFSNLLNINRSSSVDIERPQHPPSSDEGERSAPLFSQLPAHKQQLVAGLLSSRFRSAGCMDITKEISESEEKAQRAKVESLETVEPRDHAVATESYGALTRRRLTWHPDRVLCKRINVPHPFPESTFVGCPDERRPRNPFRFRRLGRKHAEERAEDFSLFDLLDVNRGLGSNPPDEDEGISESEEDQAPELVNNSSNITDQPAEASVQVASPQTSVAPPENSIFACLFQAARSSGNQPGESVIQPPPSRTIDEPKSKELHSATRQLGPHLPNVTPSATDFDEHSATQKPSMDLFKSIFASDEELDSSSSDEGNSPSVSAAGAQPVPSTLGQPGMKGATSFLARMFEPMGDIPDSFSIFSNIGPRATQTDNSKVTANLEPDATLTHGPDLPPGFVSTSTSAATYPRKSSVVVSNSNDKGDDVEWTDANVGTSYHKSEKRKHSKHKHSKKHKRSHKHPKSSDKDKSQTSDFSD